MTQIQGEQGVIKAYPNARKLFQISSLPIAVMSYGIGNIGPRSIQSFMREFGSIVSSKQDVKSVSESLLGFVKTTYDTGFAPLSNKPILGFYVAGYSTESVFADEWEFLLPNDSEPRQVRPETGFGAAWRGIMAPFSRLYFGFDARIEGELRKQGLWNNSMEKVFKSFQSPIVFDGMPVQDAVNFAVFIVNTTVGTATFEIGVPSCGGPLQLATIFPDEGFKWVLNPQITVQND
jgi:hypothetical protein